MGEGGVSGGGAVTLDLNTQTQNSMYANCVSTDLWRHTHTHTHTPFTEDRRVGLDGCCVTPGHSLHNNPGEGGKLRQHTDLRWGPERAIWCFYTHLHTYTHTHAGVSTHLEHVPAACMLVCTCNHACCYLRAGAGGGPWRGEVQGLQGLTGGKGCGCCPGLS